MRYSLISLVAVCVSLAAAKTNLMIGQACASIGDPNWKSNCGANDRRLCINLCDGRCQSGDQGRWMANPNGDCDCYCN
ncbi:uncharacterized protein CTRU02_204168 [Colletotrichum truncatum]|uniref:Uncharacterized protein n=1 Tax=Colletotrichum truncatum TaxID=5467 RepID=A0ACC3ZBB1_COLTU|nr:uncharacterized protein CTRU02_10020 [Colletotrichum truncatum]KAF6787725.1 hypothetical protein CTRU02_10020 [Colletotrichum truncatum]